MQAKYRDVLIKLYSIGLEAVKGDSAVYSALMQRGDMPACHVIAIGKAAESMYWGAKRYLDDALKSAFLISKYGYFSTEALADPTLKLWEAAHPVPAESSLRAGEALLAHLHSLPAHEPCLFLISGGASSLCEVLESGRTLECLQVSTQQGLANGDTIDVINAWRKTVSRIKGGKLWQFLGKRPVTALLISDVPGDDPRMIGSGLLFPAPAEADFHWQIVASNQQMLQAMADSGLHKVIRIVPERLEGNAEKAAQNCVDYLRKKSRGIYLWGGETTVNLPENPGRGGRNQHLALAAAIHLQGEKKIHLLAIGSDGTDGVSDDAGALVDGATLARGKLAGLEAKAYLQQADAGTFLEASGDLVSTGPTGTNVMDVVIGLKR